MSTDDGFDGQALDRRIREAASAFVDAQGSYDRKLDDRARERLAPYHDPAKGRARVIREFSKSVSDQIAGFDETRRALGNAVEGLRMSSTTTVSALMLAGYQVAVQTGAGAGSTSDLHAHLQFGADKLQVLDAIGTGVGLEVARCLDTATAVYAARIDELERFVGGTPTRDRKAIAMAIAAPFIEDGGLVILELLVEKVIETAIPLGPILVGVIGAAKGVREKVRKIEEHYERSPLDVMFELADQVESDEELFVAVLTMIETADAAFAALADMV